MTFALLAALPLPRLAAQVPPAWSQPTATAAGTSSLHGMVFDSGRNRVVMFGGWSMLYNPGFRNQTWEWDGSTWTQVVTASAPSPRSHCMLAYDSARGRVVLFGGYDSATLGETWEYDGSDWTLRTPAHAPTPRISAGLAYDPSRGVTVLFGGELDPSGQVVTDETWEWNGSDWTQRTLPHTPSARSDMGICYDPLHQRVMMHSGYEGPLSLARDLWSYDGADWTLVSEGEGPPATYNAGLVWHPGRQRLLTCVQEVPHLGTWSWDGASWHHECGVAAPTTRRVFQMAYEPANDRVVVYGGDIGSAATYSETWLLGAGDPAPYSLQTVGTSCSVPGTSPLLQATTPPMIGTNFEVQLSGGTSGLAVFVYGFSLLPAPQPLAPLGFPSGCSLYVSPEILQVQLQAGVVTSIVALPCDPLLYGVELDVQGAVWDTSLSLPLPFVTSNGLQATIGS
ncbi:MAG: hypothetical protein H6835_16835 [Planctomycetes bacterium]|nr:hypothetical protein [Planctomycetota bacterium]